MDIYPPTGGRFIYPYLVKTMVHVLFAQKYVGFFYELIISKLNSSIRTLP